jgi:hypothetical protein
MAMIRGVLDLFLARPFGGQSLIQRYVGGSGELFSRRLVNPRWTPDTWPAALC